MFSILLLLLLLLLLKKCNSITIKSEVESLHVEMYHYVLGNRGIVNPCSSCTTDRYISQQCIMNEDN